MVRINIILQLTHFLAYSLQLDKYNLLFLLDFEQMNYKQEEQREK